MARPVQPDRKCTVPQITTLYNNGEQKCISRHTICHTLRRMGYSSRTPHRVSFLLAKNRNRMQVFIGLSKLDNLRSTDLGCLAAQSICHTPFCSIRVMDNVLHWPHKPMNPYVLHRSTTFQGLAESLYSLWVAQDAIQYQTAGGTISHCWDQATLGSGHMLFTLSLRRKGERSVSVSYNSSHS